MRFFCARNLFCVQQTVTQKKGNNNLPKHAQDGVYKIYSSLGIEERVCVLFFPGRYGLAQSQIHSLSGPSLLGFVVTVCGLHHSLNDLHIRKPPFP